MRVHSRMVPDQDEAQAYLARSFDLEFDVRKVRLRPKRGPRRGALVGKVFTKALRTLCLRFLISCHDDAFVDAIHRARNGKTAYLTPWMVHGRCAISKSIGNGKGCLMKTSTWSKGTLRCMSLGLVAGCVLVAGCQSAQNGNVLSMNPVVPEANEQIVRDQLIVIVDATGSIGAARMFENQKSTVVAFADGMPDGTYESGMDSFAGVSMNEWLDNSLAPYRREVMVTGASDLEPLGSLTPLSRAIRNQTWELAGKGGRGALLIFSDGEVRNPEEVLQACKDIQAAHGGEVCIYTVQVGSSDRGRELLQAMAEVNGCGQYYDGASLESAASMQAMERDIFFGERVTPIHAAVPVQPVTLTLNNVHFENDSSVIAAMYDAQLDEVAAFLYNNPAIRIRLAGHTDWNASNPYNQSLSERRVNAVKGALVSRGVEASRLDTSAYGETQPAVPNTSPANLHSNRRVELSVIE